MYFMKFGYLNSIRKSTIVIFVEFPTLVWQTQWQMFLLVSGQHGVSIQVSWNVAQKIVRISCIRKIVVTGISAWVFAYLLFFLFPDSGPYLLKFVRISCIRKIVVTSISARVFAYLLFFLFPDSGFYLLNGFIYWFWFIFILIYFEWRDAENQQ